MTEANASNVSVQSIKAGTFAVGGALCIRQQQAGCAGSGRTRVTVTGPSFHVAFQKEQLLSLMLLGVGNESA
jgi:hypothetical protein